MLKFVLVGFFVAVAAAIPHQKSEKWEKMKENMAECCESSNFPKEEVLKKYKEKGSFDDSPEAKMWIDCWFHKMGFMENHEFKLEKAEKHCKSDEECKKLTMCAEEASGKEENDRAAYFMNCCDREGLKKSFNKSRGE